jgi:hypothetical protein
MKKVLKTILPVLMVILLFNSNIYAGNEDRVGQAGAGELLINPWARSSGWAGANIASIRGLEAMFLNVAGTAFTPRTEVVFSHTQWLKGTDININSFGLTQKVGEAGVLGLGIMSMNFGDIEITTVELPEGGRGTFSPQFINIGLSYARIFSNSIYGGLAVKIVSESISDVGAQGICFDAGIQYVTGFNPDKDNLMFGISLKNVGPPMRYDGDGLSFRGLIPATELNMTVQQRSEQFELPSLVAIGVAYNFDLAESHKITLAASFTSNAFMKDQYAIGLQYGFKEYFMIRGGMLIEDGIFDDLERTNALTGPTGGVTFQVPFGDTGKSFGIDYSYRATDPFDGVHSFGARLNL